MRHAVVRRSWFYHFVRVLALAETAFYAAVLIDLLLHPGGPDIAGNPIVVRLVNALVSAPAIMAVGVVVLRHAKGNLVGWLLVVWGATIGVGAVRTEAFGGYAGELSLFTLSLWPVLWAIPIHFPDGEPYPRRLGRVAQGAIAATIVLLVLISYGSPVMDPSLPLREGTPNRFYVPLLHPVTALVGIVSVVPFLALLGLLVISITLRFRASHGRERQQLKYMLAATALLIALLLAGDWLHGVLQADAPLLFGVGAVLFPLLPVAGIALPILRHRLYDIDIIIRRTLVYVPLTALLTGVYAACTALLQKLFVTLTGEKSDAATVLTTLIVVAAFDPVKRGVQSLVDRWFKAAPDPARRLRGFAGQVQAELGVIDPRYTVRRLLEEAVTAFGAQGGAVWLGDCIEPIHTTGKWDGAVALHVAMEAPSVKLGMLALGERGRAGGYTAQDHAVLQEAANAVALALAQRVLLPAPGLAWGETTSPAEHRGGGRRRPTLASAGPAMVGIASALVIPLRNSSPRGSNGGAGHDAPEPQPAADGRTGARRRNCPLGDSRT